MILILLFTHLFIASCHAENWNVYVHTGNVHLAGTDSNVYLALIDSDGQETVEYQLTHANFEPEPNTLPIRNLFEKGARERFTINTPNLGPIAKINIRHDNFPPFQSDWFLDQVILERQRDGTQFKFLCHCWLRRDRPYVTISVWDEFEKINKKKNNQSSSKSNRNFVLILLGLLGLLLIGLCYYRNRREQHGASSTVNESFPPDATDPVFNYLNHSPSNPNASSSERTHFYDDVLQRWKTFRHGSRQTSAPPLTDPPSNTIPTDPPPAYEDLYPNTARTTANASINFNS